MQIRAPGFGNTSCVEYVDPSRVPVSGYFNGLVDSMIYEGFVRGHSIRGAPYDFRKAPSLLKFKILNSLTFIFIYL